MKNINQNTEPLYRWIFRKEDNLNQVVFLFISKKNAINARFSPLFFSSKTIRVVYLSGCSFKYLDKIIMLAGKRLFSLKVKKVKLYKILHVFDFNLISSVPVQVLHIDDPKYSKKEVNDIILWESTLSIASKKSILIVTNSYTKNWFLNHLSKTEIIIIEQGFHYLDKNRIIVKEEKKDFVCAYSSNFIHYGSDKHGNDTTWGARYLLDEVIPKITKLDPTIKFCLIGELGKQAEIKISTYSNVKAYGRVSFEKNMELLMTCDIALYPRLIDHRRSILKIFSYIGADLPIVAIDLIDTEIVKREDLGFVTTDIDGFVLKVLELKNSNFLMERFKGNIQSIKVDFTWDNLSLKMENYLQKYLS
jgi:glycosyltransferase involved in cell wall biosynthesis